jgi:hypothetical protein
VKNEEPDDYSIGANRWDPPIRIFVRCPSVSFLEQIQSVGKYARGQTSLNYQFVSKETWKSIEINLETCIDLIPANPLSLELEDLSVDCGLHVIGSGYSIEKT